MKPEFLNRPLDWTRASRGASDPIGYACSISATKPTPYSTVDLLIAALAVVALAAIVIGVI